VKSKAFDFDRPTVTNLQLPRIAHPAIRDDTRLMHVPSLAKYLPAKLLFHVALAPASMIDALQPACRLARLQPPPGCHVVRLISTSSLPVSSLLFLPYTPFLVFPLLCFAILLRLLVAIVASLFSKAHPSRWLIMRGRLLGVQICKAQNCTR
jgi:hypothetical protein